MAKAAAPRRIAVYASLAAVAALLCWQIRGTAALQGALNSTAAQFIGLIPELIFGLTIATMLGALVPQQKVARFLGHDSGWRGLVLATALGMVVPGGPPSLFPLVLGLKKAGADVGALIAFISAWASLSLSRILVWEVPLLGIDFALERFLIGLPIPLLAGLTARTLTRSLLRAEP